MSDYLTNIVARNLEIAPRLEPRLASTFEPPSRHGDGIGPRVEVSPIDGADRPDRDEEIERAPVRSTTPAPRASDQSGAAEHPLTQNAASTSRTPVHSLPPGQPRQSVLSSEPAAIAPAHDAPPVPIATGSAPRIAQPPTAPLEQPQHAPDESNSDRHPPLTKPLDSPAHTRARADDAAVSDHHEMPMPAASPIVRQPARVSASMSGGAIVQRAPTISASAPPVDRGIVSVVSAARSDVNGSRPPDTGSRDAADVRAPRAESAPPSSSDDGAAIVETREGIEPSRLIRTTVVSARRHEPMAAAQQPAGWPSLAQPAAETPTTIHITIGRIEVKATPAAKAQPRTAAPAASSSLDEYLRRRADRGER